MMGKSGGIFVLCLLLFSGISHANEGKSTALRFGLKSTIHIPTALLSEASMTRGFNPDSLFIATKDKGVLSITPLNREHLGLSEEFDLREFPQYALMLITPKDDIQLSDREVLTAFSSVFGKNTKDDQIRIEVSELESGTLYTRCTRVSCHNFLSEHAQSEEILMLESARMDNSIVPQLINGGSQNDS